MQKLLFHFQIFICLEVKNNHQSQRPNDFVFLWEYAHTEFTKPKAWCQKAYEIFPFVKSLVPLDSSDFISVLQMAELCAGTGTLTLFSLEGLTVRSQSWNGYKAIVGFNQKGF